MRWTALALALGALTVGCQSGGGLPEVKGGLEFGLRRGAAWSTLTVRPPYVIGSRVNLKVEKGAFTGSIDGGSVNLRIDGEGISGRSRVGSVALQLESRGDELEVEGMWNGARVHFTFAPRAIKGTVAIFQARSLSNVIYCQYALDRVEASGAHSGTSICAGLPEDTLLEVPAAAQSWLTRQELVVVLLALFSTPPSTSLEPSMEPGFRPGF